ncbi:protein of unknown function [Enterobacter cancerogenus]|nr:protein of unknown function [Enterobacter cancerogenus]
MLRGGDRTDLTEKTFCVADKTTAECFASSRFLLLTVSLFDLLNRIGKHL